MALLTIIGAGRIIIINNTHRAIKPRALRGAQTKDIIHMHFADAKGILSPHNGMNIYRGCQHGCIYCDSRSRCYHIDHAFVDIEVKQNAPQLLEAALRRKRSACMVSTGSMSDPYMPCELTLGLTRRCLEIIEEYSCGATVLTKSPEVLRDLELFKRINKKAKAVVQMTLTTADPKLCAVLEPHVAPTAERAAALSVLRDNGIPTVVWLSPLLPFINDTEQNLRAVLDLCIQSEVKGIICFGIGLTLREGNREYFYSALDRSFPGLKQKYIDYFGSAYECASPRSAALMRIFHAECEAHGIMHSNEQIFSYLRDLPNTSCEQLSFFS